MVIFRKVRKKPYFCKHNPVLYFPTSQRCNAFTPSYYCS